MNEFHSFDLGIPKNNWRIRASIPNPKSQVKRAEANRVIAGERLRAGANTAWLSGMDEMLDA